MKLLSIVLLFFISNGYGQTKDTIWFSVGQPELTDSTKYYYKKYIYWDNKMHSELQRLNKNGHGKDISKALVRYQDSSIRYKILLENYKVKQ